MISYLKKFFNGLVPLCAYFILQPQLDVRTLRSYIPILPEMFTKTDCVSSITTRSESPHVVVATFIIYLYLQRPCFALHLQQGWFRSRSSHCSDCATSGGTWIRLHLHLIYHKIIHCMTYYIAGVFVEKLMTKHDDNECRPIPFLLRTENRTYASMCWCCSIQGNLNHNSLPCQLICVETLEQFI